MSMVPSVKVYLKDGLSQQEKASTLAEIKQVKGVLSANFNPAATYINMNYSGQAALNKVEQIENVERIDRRHRL